MMILPLGILGDRSKQINQSISQEKTAKDGSLTQGIQSVTPTVVAKQ